MRVLSRSMQQNINYLYYNRLVLKILNSYNN